MRIERPNTEAGWRHEPDPSRADRLVGDVYAAPGMPAEMRDSLARKLDREFAFKNDPVLAARNRTLSALLQRKHELTTPVEPSRAARFAERDEMSRLRRELHDLAAPTEVKRHTGGWIAFGVAAAAVVLACVLTRPAYHWDNVLDAVGDQEYVAISIEGELLEGAPFIMSTHGANPRDLDATRASYFSISGELVRPLLPREDSVGGQLPNPRSADDIEGDLLALLTAALPGDSKDASDEFRIVSESAPILQAEGVRLDLQMSGRNNQLTASFLLDPVTKLPVECVLQDAAAGSKPRRLRFSYPPADGE